jgi:ABC-2 type transport system ATP-binding protein
MIQVNNLYKSYGNKDVLSDISIELFPGQIQGLVGENGSGKTTMFECIRNLTKYKGSIIIAEAAKIGYLPSAPYFYPKMKGIEYLEFCLSARKMKINKMEITKVNELFELPLNEYAENYSTGMKKKLALIALLMQKNDILILDEPFNGLDLGSCILVKHLFLHLKEKSKTIFLSSHIISSLTDISDRIFYLHNGMIKKIFFKEDFKAIEKEIMNSSIGRQLESVAQFDF